MSMATISTYAEYLELRAAFIDMLTQPFVEEPPAVCENCRGFNVDTLATIVYFGTYFCAVHAMAEDIDQIAAAVFLAREAGVA
jgi:hypothetical protein